MVFQSGILSNNLIHDSGRKEILVKHSHKMVAFYLLGNKCDKKVAGLSSHVVCVQLCYLRILFHFYSLLHRASLVYYSDNYLGMGISITWNTRSCNGKTIPMHLFGDNTVIQH